jgi:signal transduction histidine kinase
MQNKITFKLFLSFALALLFFSLVVGSGFAYLFREHTIDIKKQDLEQRAVKIAQALGDSRDQMIAWQEKEDAALKRGQVPPPEREMDGRDNGKRMPRLQGPMGLGFNSVLRFLGSAAAEDVWIVDADQNLEMPAHPEGKKPAFMYKDLPPDAEKVVRNVMQGTITTSSGFSNMLEVPTLTVGAPIKDKDGEILGAVLIHAPLSGMDMAAKQATRILLMCGGIALLAAFLLAVYSSWRFTKPLKTMQQTAERMTEGDYTVRCDVRQHDEIGELGTALDSLGERLLVASKESAQLDQMRKDFIANISHELRTPVTVIRGSLEALNDRVVTLPEQVEEYYRQMLSETIFLQRLINDLLDLSRLQNLNFKIEMTKLNLYDVLLDVVHGSQRLGKSKNIDVVLETDTKWYPVEGDYGRLRQMLMIFMDNAVKFSTNNGQVKLVLQGKKLEIVDHGIGVASEMVPHVFERFYKMRVEKNKSGTGLGLAIAKEIAERHGMEVVMESQPGIETKIIVLLGK